MMQTSRSRIIAPPPSAISRVVKDLVLSPPAAAELRVLTDMGTATYAVGFSVNSPEDLTYGIFWAADGG